MCNLASVNNRDRDAKEAVEYVEQVMGYVMNTDIVAEMEKAKDEEDSIKIGTVMFIEDIVIPYLNEKELVIYKRTKKCRTKRKYYKRAFKRWLNDERIIEVKCNVF